MKKIIILFAVLNYFIVGAQNQSKLDKKFQVLIENQEILDKGGKITILPSPYGFDSKISKKSGKLKYGCVIYTKEPDFLVRNGIEVQSILPNFVTALVSIDELKMLEKSNEVKFIESPDSVELNNDIAVASSGASLLHAGAINNTSYKGKGIIVGVYDSGIDWKHPDFRDPVDQTKSRILSIWDQTITATGTEVTPAGFTYGVEYTQAQINDEIDGTPASFVREADTNGHGTHVAGTAAGNGMALATRKHSGMAPEADIVIVKGGNGSFPTTNTVDALTYFTNIANLYNRPVVVNMSIGGQFGPHDGTRPHEVAVDNFTNSGTGRVVVISAGNDNGNNTHKRDILNPAASATTSFVVPTNTTATDFFSYRLYVNDATDVTAVATAPGGENVTANAGQSNNLNVIGGAFTLNLSNMIDAANGDRYVEIYLQRNGTNTTDVAGTWTLNITNNGAANITTDGWLYYRNAAVSTTSLTGGDSISLVGSPGNANNAITAASYVGRLGWFSTNTGTSGGYITTGATQDGISTFSANGPRRDGVQKPDIAASGQNMISAMSTGTLAATSTDNIDGTYYRKNQGTSMSAPVVTGAVALLLQVKPSLTFAEIKTAIRNNAQTDVSTGAVPNTVWGYGKLDVYKAAGSILECTVPNRKTYLYENPYTSTQDGNVALTTQRIAVNFTPDITGKLGGFYFHTVSNTGAGGTFNLTSLSVEVRANNAGNPGALLASKVIATNSVSKFSWNYYDLSDLNVNITNATDYFIVLVPGAGSTWGVRRDNVVVDNRSRISTDDGATWTTAAVDYRIRSVVYEAIPQITTLVSAASLDTRVVTGTTSVNFIDNCGLISTVLPNSTTPVAGKTNAKVWLEASQSANFVKRHYEITPEANANSATAKITLYFTQQEFDDYNAVNTNKLPQNPSDNTGKANLVIEKYAGVSSDNTGLPNTYSGSSTIIDPNDADVVWDNTYNYWKVSFDVTGFSGFFARVDPALSTSSNEKISVRIYPNPANDVVNISLEDVQNAKVAIYDSIGRLIKMQNITSEMSQIHISELPKGVYIFNVESNSGKIAKQIVKI